MIENETVDYLVIGGERHGEVWYGPYGGNSLQLDKKNQPLPKMYLREQQAEVTVPLSATYTVTEHQFRGKIYLIASSESFSVSEADQAIENLIPDRLRAFK